MTEVEPKGERPGSPYQFKTGPALCIIFALVALGFGVYEFVHAEFSRGSLSVLLAIVIVNFALRWKGAYGD
jgi:hypothetical protein